MAKGMRRTAVTNQVCRFCGADVRSGSAFCYNCGKSVTAQGPKGGAPTERLVPVKENHTPPTQRLDPEAASLRSHPENAGQVPTRSARPTERKPVEITWVERDGDSPVLLIGTLVIAA